MDPQIVLVDHAGVRALPNNRARSRDFHDPEVFIPLPIGDLLPGIVYGTGEHIIPVGHHFTVHYPHCTEGAGTIPPLHLAQAVQTHENHFPVRGTGGIAQLPVSIITVRGHEEALVRQLVDEMPGVRSTASQRARPRNAGDLRMDTDHKHGGENEGERCSHGLGCRITNVGVDPGVPKYHGSG
jgi:hypothetical protein